MELTGLPDCSAPMPWHIDAWNRITGQVNSGRLPHALMLVGAAYTGLDRLALALARLLLCEAPQGGLNCGYCHACELSASGAHGDFLWLQPEDKSRVIKIDQVRTAVALAQQTASFGERKVIVLSPAEVMNAAAANALLKSLEEPAPGTHMVLTCSQLHAVPATIRSRCQLLKLPVPSRGQSLAWLDQVTGDRGSSERLLDLCDGLPLLAETMFREPHSEQLHAARLACRGLFGGQLPVGEVIELLAGSPVPEVLDQLITSMQRTLSALDAEALSGAGARRGFALLDELGELRLAVEGGANPNAQLLAEVLVGKVQDLLGALSPDDSMGQR